MAKAQTAAKRSDASLANASAEKIVTIPARGSRRAGIDIADMLAKLQSLNDTLDQQESALSSWPDSPGKDSVAEAIRLARDLAAKIARDFGDAASPNAPTRGIQTAPHVKTM
jgi:hypothetical protein